MTKTPAHDLLQVWDHRIVRADNGRATPADGMVHALELGKALPALALCGKRVLIDTGLVWPPILLPACEACSAAAQEDELVWRARL